LSENEIEMDEETTPASDEFARLFEASYASTKRQRLSNGQAVEGTIVAIGEEVALIDVGAKGEATIAVAELKNDEGVVEAKVGDRIHATIVSTTGGISLSRRMQRGAANSRQIENAANSGLAVEGKVEKAVKAGYEVTVAGQRAFCPQSQIDDVRDSDPASHIGRVYGFKIVEYSEGGQKFVVSRRRLLEEEQRAKAEEIRKKIVPEAVLTGKVVSVREFGAFVDLGGGVQGLLHASEMSWARTADPSSMLKPGDELTVMVLRVEEGGKIALGLKQLSADPWTMVTTNYKIGQVLTGRITRIAEFGAFVELEPGVEALAHASTFAPTGKPGGWSKSITVGTTRAFEIMAIEPDKKRIGVAQIEEGTSRAGSARPSPTSIVAGARIMGKVERHDKMGVFVFLTPGVTGLVPSSETGVARETEIQSVFPVGSDIDVVVLEADAARRRVRLSVKAIAEAAERAVVNEYSARTSTSQGQSFGSLADKLRGALESRKK
jgi:small subunit ribosomal protein S1